MAFIVSLHEFDSARLLLAKGDSDSLKSLWPKYRILDAARISDVLRGYLNFKNARFRWFYNARFTWSPSAPTKRSASRGIRIPTSADLRPHHWTGDYRRSPWPLSRYGECKPAQKLF
jgi:hypothetical protein